MNGLQKFLKIFFIFVCLFGVNLGAAWAEEVVLTTNSWTAAFVEAAAAETRNLRVVTLAGLDLRHPPEYELRPSDVILLSNSAYFVFAGYEALVPRIRHGSLKVGGTQVQIQTVNTPRVIRESVIRLARVFGTEKEAERNVQEIERFFAEWKQELDRAGLQGATVVCHVFMAPLAKELGFTVLGTFGPAPLEAARIAELAGMNPRFLLDNWHIDAGRPLIRAIPNIPVATLINFPGKDGTRSLLDVLTYNRNQIQALYPRAR